MKADRTKHSYRFSPLAPRRTNTPSLSHPRKASEDTLARKSTAKLFASQANEFEAPLSGYGALCSQVSETQFFAQFGVDVSLPIANAYSPATSPVSSPVSSPMPSPSKQPPHTPPKINTSLLHDPLENYQYGSRLRGPLLGVPKYIDFSPEPYCWGDPLANDPDMDLDPWPVDVHGNEMRPGTAQPPWEDQIHAEFDQVTPASPASPAPSSSS
ncbi:hypothetical protein B0H14DRAFT_2564442 [Mycena olivaceomarginata]|nr:hypothetical protein B0H14DRAFT_2564442 [Mycena olivaceomarginata]